MDVLTGGDVTRRQANDLAVLAHLGPGWYLAQGELVACGHWAPQADRPSVYHHFVARRQLAHGHGYLVARAQAQVCRRPFCN
jgi:hypothetical protein